MKQETADEKIKRAKFEKPRIKGMRNAQTPLGKTKSEKEEKRLRKKAERQNVKAKLRRIKSFKDFLEDEEYYE